MIRCFSTQAGEGLHLLHFWRESCFDLEGASDEKFRIVVKDEAKVLLTASRDESSSCQAYPWIVAKLAWRQSALGFDCIAPATRYSFQFVVAGTEA